jgi:hypothetical protein
MNNVGPVSGANLNFYELAQEPISGNFYASTTDFFSTGTVYIYDAANSEIHQFAAGVSPGTIVFDIRSSAGVTTDNTADFTVSPNPSNGMINIHGKTENAIVTLTDLNGMMIDSTSNDTLNIETLPAGIYFVHINGMSQKVIKL